MQRYFRESILEVFGDGTCAAALVKIGSIPATNWPKLLNWMDASGFALYFLARLNQLEATHHLPRFVLERLQQNLRDNRERTAANITELLRIQEAFAKAGIAFMLLKGLSLVPQACPDAALRLQLDIDLLVDPRSTSLTQRALSTLGYQLFAVSGNTWEYKTSDDMLPRKRNLYKTKSQRSIEIHVPSSKIFDKHFNSSDRYFFEGCSVPVLSAVERFLWQAEHVDKHIRFEWSRVSWLLEFRNNINFYRHDPAFWLQVKEAIRHMPSRWGAIGMATALTRTILPETPEVALLREAEAELSPVLKLWLEQFGRRVITSDFPGSKLYLLQPGHPASPRHSLLPLHAPQSVAIPSGKRTFASSMYALRDFTSHCRFRAAFHLREAMTFVFDYVRWQQLLTQHRKSSLGPQSPVAVSRQDSRVEASL